jgi:hypothetical protein
MTKDARPWARFAARPQGPQSRSRGLVRGGALADGAGLRRRATGRASETIAAAHLLVAKEKKAATLIEFGPQSLVNPHSPDDALSFGTDGAIQI